MRAPWLTNPRAVDARPRLAYDRRMPSLRWTLPLVVAATVLAGSAAPAHAGVGVVLFLGRPLGFTVKADLKPRTALEVLLGVDDWNRDRGRGGYAHVTFLATPFVARGSSVLIPFRLGIGGAIFDDGGDFGNDLNVAARAPFELAFQFRRSPVELYLEISLRMVLVDSNDNDPFLDVDGGAGFRLYF